MRPRSISARHFSNQQDIFMSKHNASPRDRSLPFFAGADYDEISQVLPLPACSSRRQRGAIAAIVAGMLHHVRMRRGDQWISYSRDRSRYAGQDFYHGEAYGYAPVVGAIDRLAAAGFFTEHDRKPQTKVATGIQSRFRPKAGLLLGHDLPRIPKPAGQLIRLRDRKTRVLEPFRETRNVARMRAFVSRINRHIAETDIQFHGGQTRDGTICHFARHSVDLADMSLYRVFSGDWSMGGRFYGACWQSMTKEDRQKYRINGEAVVEHDYRSLHPRILYTLLGRIDLDWDGYDAYAIPGFGDQRKACKRAFNIMLNANSASNAVGAVAEHVRSGSFIEAREMIEAIKSTHPGLVRLFHSDIGIKLQWLDAEMCRGVLDAMVLQRGITTLPIHDSFIVPAFAGDELVQVMETVFDRIIGRTDIRDLVDISVFYPKTILHNGGSCPAPRSDPSCDDPADSESEA